MRKTEDRKQDQERKDQKGEGNSYPFWKYAHNNRWKQNARVNLENKQMWSVWRQAQAQ